ncbi:MAG: hypothetical protein GY815_16440 [Gammaproteobacteria bacterium]|nr:hypothetical protein [Gammaproteobacteria bacterium]
MNTNITNYIEAHGFKTAPTTDGAGISFLIPVVLGCEVIGDYKITVTNMREARIALGY